MTTSSTSFNRTDSSTHFMGDQEIQINGDTADVETYAIIYILYTVEGARYQSMRGIHYEDEMVSGMTVDGRSNTGWCTVTGDAVSGWTRPCPVSIRCPSPNRKVYLGF